MGATQAVDAAAAVGYAKVGLRVLPAAPGGRVQDLLDQPASLRETVARCKDTGVGVFDVELIRIDERFDAHAYDHVFDLAQTLGASAILLAGDDANMNRMAASFAAVCDVMAGFGLTADLEFMPWTAVPNLGSARRLLEAAGSPANAGILIDALHFARSESTLEEVTALPRSWLHYAQVCDAPAGKMFTDSELIHTARCARLLPGDGGIDLAGLVAALPPDLPISVEVPNDEQAARLGETEWARRALARTRALLENVTAALPHRSNT